MLSFCVSALLAVSVVILRGQACNIDKDMRKWARGRIDTLNGCKALSAGSDADVSMPDVKLFLYHNDEEEVLSDFLQYHSYAFGAKNIIVIDQNSQNKAICKTLALFQLCGTKIIDTSESFLSKGAVLSAEMRKYENIQSLLIPLDTDEFIFPFSKNSTLQVDVNREDLWKAFRALPIDGRKYKFEYYTIAHPSRSGCLSSPASREVGEYRRAIQNNAYFAPEAPIHDAKSFFYSDGFIRTDDGNHIGLVKNDNDTSYHVNRTNIPRYFANLGAQMVHFAIGSYRGAYDKYRRASINMGFHGDSDCTVRRPGGHYCKLCKIYINGTDHGARLYTDKCIVPERNVSTYTVVSDWFKNNTLSMAQLVGSI